MRVLLVSEYFYPDSSGGTERYVLDLAKGLKEINAEVVILTISTRGASYFFEGIEVHSISRNSNLDAKVISGLLPADNINEFAEKIRELDPAVIHFHTYTTSINVYHFKIAKNLGKMVVFTSHIPGNTCIRGDLMRYGEKVCDGEVRGNACLSCYLNAQGLPKFLSPAVAGLIRRFKIPELVSKAADTKLSQIELIKYLGVKVVTMSNWQMEVFKKNGFSGDQLVLSRHPFRNIPGFKTVRTNDTLTIGFAGRVSPEKGLHILIAALKRKNIKHKILIAAIKVKSEEKYLQKLLSETKNDGNIYWCFNYSADTIDEFYQNIDILCIPSICMETGPYVMFEAIARHIPVIGSNLGGMCEWANAGYPVGTFEPNNINGLAEILRHLPASIRMTGGSPPSRSCRDIAIEMTQLYEK